MDYLIVYQKLNGDVIFRPVKNFPLVKIGDKTSMGWKVLDIQYFCNNRFYSYSKFNKLLKKYDEDKKKRIQRENKLNSVKEFFKKNRNIGG
jgi:hypothetical protein